MGLVGNPQLLCFGSEEKRCFEGPALDFVLGASFLFILIVIVIEVRRPCLGEQGCKSLVTLKKQTQQDKNPTEDSF